MLNKELEEPYKLLIGGLKEMGIGEATTVATALMLRTERQIIIMLDWITKHHKEKTDEDRVLRIAKLISQEVK